MTGRWVLETPRGPIALRPEQPEDADFLYALFRSHTLPGLAPVPVDDAMKESLVRMQFVSRTATYRAQYPDADFAILERDGMPIGCLAVHESAGAACIVDVALTPESRGAGIGSALLTSLVARLGDRCPIVRCMVLSTNEASLRMCRRAGFVRVGDVPPHVELEWRRPG